MKIQRNSAAVLLKKQSASVHCHPTARAPSMKKDCPPPEGSPDSLIATQAINGRTEKFIRFLGWVSAIDSSGRTIWIADGHRDDGKGFVVHADEKLTAFMELESAIRAAPARS